jgi:hypothetical protein
VGERSGPEGARRRTYDFVGVLSRYVGFDYHQLSSIPVGYIGKRAYLTEFELLDFKRSMIPFYVLFEEWFQFLKGETRANSSKFLAYFIAWHASNLFKEDV